MSTTFDKEWEEAMARQAVNEQAPASSSRPATRTQGGESTSSHEDDSFHAALARQHIGDESEEAGRETVLSSRGFEDSPPADHERFRSLSHGERAQHLSRSADELGAADRERQLLQARLEARVAQIRTLWTECENAVRGFEATQTKHDEANRTLRDLGHDPLAFEGEVPTLASIAAQLPASLREAIGEGG